jgi:putative SOS response-associated peptidase YedK
MRWALVPSWWNKTLKESMKLASFNARAETITTKPFFRELFRTKRCLMPVSGYYEWQRGAGQGQIIARVGTDSSAQRKLDKITAASGGTTFRAVGRNATEPTGPK